MIKQNRKIKRTILSVLKGISEKNRTTILMGTPEIINTTQKIVVTVPYFLNVNDNSILACRSERLSKINGVELRWVQLKSPFLDRGIFAQYLAINAGKYNFMRLKRLSEKNVVANVPLRKFLPSAINGFKFKISGRLTTQRRRPRKTVITAQKGFCVSEIHNNNNSTFNQFTSKNKLGAFNVKVWLGNHS